MENDTRNAAIKSGMHRQAVMASADNDMTLTEWCIEKGIEMKAVTRHDARSMTITKFLEWCDAFGMKPSEFLKSIGL